MTAATTTRPTIVKWGWLAHLVMTALLTVNGVVLYFISSRPSVFEQDTGIRRDEVEAMFPTVVDQVVREGQLIGILLAGLGLLAFVIAFGGYRHDSRVAWNGIWALIAVLVVLATRLIVVGNGRVAGVYIAFGGIFLLGQLVIQRGSGRRVPSSQ